jgi:uncharacterized membrane protein
MSESKPPEPVAAPAPGNSPVAHQKEHPKTLAEVIQEKAPEILEAIPVGQRTKLSKLTIEATQVSYRSGLLPEPTELAAYNAIIPNGADRIMKMAEAQSAHRIELERTVVGSQQGQEKRGQWFGLIIAIFFASCGSYAALNGQPWFGGIIAGTTLVSLVSVFVFSKHQSKKELSDKRQGNMMPTAVTPSPPNQPNQKHHRRK